MIFNISLARVVSISILSALSLLFFSIVPFQAFASSDIEDGGLDILSELTVDNPDLIIGPCQSLDVVLVLDASGSINTDNENIVRNATLGLAQALEAGGGQMAIIQFSTTSAIVDVDGGGPGVAGYRTVDSDFVSDLSEYLFPGGVNPPASGTSGYEADGWTNWEDAFDDVIALNQVQTADLVVFVTDGNPTAYNAGSSATSCGSFGCSASLSLSEAQPKADLIKQAGSHMFGLAVGGDVTLSNIAAVTGPEQDLTPGDGDGFLPTTADYAAIPFSELQACFNDIVSESCSPTIALEKSVYAGQDAGASCPGSESLSGFNGESITYCFSITNTGDTHLELVSFDDPSLGLDENSAGLVLSSGSYPLAPASSVTYYYESSIDGDLTNIATVQLNPVDANGGDLGLADVLDVDTASVIEDIDPCLTLPSIDCPANVMVGCGESTEPANTGEAIATSSSGINGITFEDEMIPVTDNCPIIGRINRTWTAVDECGNTATCVQVIRTRDITPPTVVCPPDAYVECGGNTAPEATGKAGGSDDCGVVFINHSDSTEPNCGSTVTIERTWTVTDECGNSESCVQMIFEVDTIAPTFDSTPEDATVDCQQVPAASVLTATDDCGNASVEMQEEIGEGCPYTITRTYTATDDCGNTATLVQTITVVDTTAPELLGLPEDQTADCATSLEFIDSQFSLRLNGSGLPSSASISFGAEFGPPVATISVTAEVVLVDDGIDVATDGCETILTDLTGKIALIDRGSCTFVSKVLNAQSAGAVGVIVTNNTDTGVFTMGGEDSTIVIPSVFISQTDGDALKAALLEGSVSANIGPLTVSASDDCGEAVVTLSESEIPGECPITSILTRTWTAVDDCGNSSTAEQVITFVDEQGPLVQMDQTEASLSCVDFICDYEALLDFEAGLLTQPERQALRQCVVGQFFELGLTPTDVIDNCSEELDWEETEVEVVVYEECNENITAAVICYFTAVDDCGNAADTVISTLNLIDTIAPFIMCPADISVQCDEDTSPLNTGKASGDDECGFVTINHSDETEVIGECPVFEVITRTWVVRDACGNSTACTQTITVVDTEEPIFQTLPTDITLECGAEGNSLAVSEWLLFSGGASAIDDCGEVTLSNNYQPGSCGNTYSATWDESDPTWLAGPCWAFEGENSEPNLSFYETLDFEITMAGEYTFTMLADTTYDGIAGIYENSFDPEDACSNLLAGDDDLEPEQFETEPILIVTLNMVPGQYILVSSTFSGDGMQSGDFSWTFEGPAPLVYDCGGCSEGTGVFPVAFTATDECGNTETATANVIINDTTAPILTVEASDESVECGEGDFNVALQDWAADNGGAQATDLCGNVTWSNDLCAAGENDRTIDGSAEWIGFVNAFETPENGGGLAAAFGYPVPDLVALVDAGTNSITLKPNRNDVPQDDAFWFNPDGSGNKIVDANVFIGDNTLIGQSFTWSASVVSNTLDPDYENFAFIRVFNADFSVLLLELTAPLVEGETFSLTYENDQPDAGQIQYGFSVIGRNINPLPEFDEAYDALGSVVVEAVECGLSDLCAETGDVTVTFTATDDCGNATSTEATFSIIDTTPPVSEVPEDYELQCGEWAEFSDATHSDNCSDSLDVDFDQEMVEGDCMPYARTLVRTWTVTDECGNSSVTSQNIFFVDTIGPEITCAPDVTVNCGEPTGPEFTGKAFGSDICGQVTVNHSDEEIDGNCPAESTILRTWIVRDECGNESTCLQTITIVDNEGPVLEVNPDATVECAEAFDLVGYAAEDNCSEFTVTIDSTFTPDNGVCLPNALPSGSATAAKQQSLLSSDMLTYNSSGQPGNLPSGGGDGPFNDNCEGATVTALIVDGPSVTVSGDATGATDVGIGANQVFEGFTLDACADVTIDFCDSETPNISNAFIILTQCPVAEPFVVGTAINDCANGAFTATWTSVPAGTYYYPVLADDVFGGGAGPYTINLMATSCAPAPSNDNLCDAQSIAVGTVISTSNSSATPDGPQAGCWFDESVQNDIWFSFVATTENIELETFNTGGNNDTQVAVFSSSDGTCSGVLSEIACNDDISDTDFMSYVQMTGLTVGETYYIQVDGWNGTQGAFDLELRELGEFCTGPGFWTFTYTATDECGNATVEEQVVTVVDTQAPVVVLGATSASVECSDFVCDYSLVEAFAAGELTQAERQAVRQCVVGEFEALGLTPIAVEDDCSCELGWSEINVDVVIAEECINGFKGFINCEFQAEDDCGNLSEIVVSTLLLRDDTAPDLEFAGDETIECGDEIPEPDSEAFDACGEVDVTITETTEDDCGQTYTLTRTYTATDECGNTTVGTQVITVVDTTPPTIYPPEDFTVECGGNTEPANTGKALGEDSCGPVSVNHSDSEEPDCANTKTITRTWVVTDACGNTATHVQYIYEVDTIPPTISCPPDVMVDCATGTTDPAEIGSATASDDCGSVVVDYFDGQTEGECPATFIRTWIATDECGNTATCEQAITIIDELAPSISDAVDLELECGTDVQSDIEGWLASNGGAQASDDCGTITWSNDYCGEGSGIRTIDGSAEWIGFVNAFETPENGGGLASAFGYPVPDLVALVDAGTNSITLKPNRNDVPQDDAFWFNPDGSGNKIVDANVFIGDNTLIGQSFTWSASVVSNTLDPDYENFAFIRVFNSDFSVLLLELTAPLVEGETFSLTYENDQPDAGQIQYGFSVIGRNINPLPEYDEEYDALGSVVVEALDCSISESCGQTGEYLVTFTATDNCGNAASTEATVSIIDTTAPELEIAGDVTIECGQELPAPDYGAFDQCGGVTVQVIPDTTDRCGETFIMERTYIATDDCGNSSIATQTLTVVDTTAPTIVCPLDITIECDESTEPSNTGKAFGDDDCGFTTVNHSDETVLGECFGERVITRTWVVRDQCDNETTCEQVITVVDTTAPEFTSVPDDITVSCDSLFFPDNDNLCDAIELTVNADFEFYTNEFAFAEPNEVLGSCLGGSGVIQSVWFSFEVPASGEATVSTDFPDTELHDTQLTIYELTGDCSDLSNLVEIACDEDGGEAEPNGFTSVASLDSLTPGEIYYIQVDSWNDQEGEFAIQVTDVAAPILAGLPSNSEEKQLLSQSNSQAKSLLIDFPTATDNCSSTSINREIEFVEACGETGTYSITYTASDDCGNTAIYVQTITVIDDEAPTIVAADDVTVECGEELPAPSATADDGCGEATWTVDSEITEGCGETYTMVRTYTATDDCGNTALDTQTITVVDTTPPVVILDQDSASVECTEFNCDYENMLNYFSLTPAERGPLRNCIVQQFSLYGLTPTGVQDNCSGDLDWEETEVDINILSPCENGVTVEITCFFEATDDCGNTSEVVATTLYLTDYNPPTIVCPPNRTVECGEDTSPAALGKASAGYECGLITINHVDDFDPSCGDTGVIIRTWTATDACGNTNTCEQIITIIDTTNPIIIDAPEDMQVDCDAIPAPADLEVMDCSNVNIQFSETQFSGGCLGVLERIWIVTDECGNETVHVQFLTLIDTTPPVLEQPEDEVYECGEEIADAPDLSATDNCSEDITIEFSADTIGNTSATEYTIIRTWTATDICLNSSTVTQVISVIESAPPVIEANPDATVECGVEFDLAGVNVLSSSSEVVVNIDSAFVAGCGNTGVWTITYTATDECGSSAVDTQTITIVDTTAPEFVGLEPFVEYECDNVPVPDLDVAVDNCGLDVEVTYTDQGFAGGCFGNISRIFIATDACGNSSTYEQSINLIDSTDPVFIEVPADLTLSCDEEIPFAIDPIALDICDPDVEIDFAETILPGPGNCLSSFEIQRIWIATDDCGNQAIATQVISVIDETPPLFVGVPEDELFQCSDQIPPPADVGAFDNCSEVSVVFNEESIGGLCENTIVRTWTATDDCGNEASVSQSIFIIDETAPEIVCPADITVECTESTEPSNTGMATASDNCALALLDYIDGPISGSCPAQFQRVWAATDQCGNRTECIQTISIDDTTPPVFEGVPGDLVLECGDDVPEFNITATDICSDVVIDTVIAFIDVFDECQDGVGVFYSLTATDACGNSAVASYSITSFDTTAPELFVANDVTVECGDTIPEPDFEVFDTCSNVDVQVDSEVQNACGFTRIEVRTYTATDACGNSTVANQTVTVVDNTSPVLSITDTEIIIDCSADDIPAPPDVTAFDECSGPLEVSVLENLISNDCQSSFEFIYTATDECGNSSQATWRLLVVDQTPPVFDFMPDDIVLEDCGDIPAPIIPTVSDNCSANVTVDVTEDFFSQTNTIVRTFIANDNCGNSSEDVQVITIIDSEDPVILCPADTTACIDEVQPELTGIPVVIDNCDESADLSFTDGNLILTGAGGPQFERIWLAIDNSGNQSTCSQTIFVDFDCEAVDPECEVYQTAPVDVTKSFDPVNGVQNRVQLKWYKESPQIKYTDEDAAMCDIKVWAVRNLDPQTGNAIGAPIQNPDTISLVDRKKTYGDGSPRSIFKWPIMFRADGANNANRVEPNVRYKFKVRCECGFSGDGLESPWSEEKFFNTLDFDPVTGVFTPSAGADLANGTNSKLLDAEYEVRIFPNPSEGEFRITTDAKTFQYTLMDVNGKEMWSHTVQASSEEVNLSGEAPGIYMLRIITDRGVYMERVVISR